MKKSRKRFDAIEFDNHKNYNRPKSNKPDKRKKECPEIEKYYAPEKV